MKYLTFPITIISVNPANIKKALNDIMDYCLYAEYDKNGYEDIKQATEDLGITYHNLNKAFENGKILFDSISKNSPKSSVSKDLIFEFYKDEKTEFENVCFMAYIAFRSIIQKQAYTKATNEYLLNRIAGNNAKGGVLPEWLLFYSNEYQINKIKKTLELKFGLKYYAFYTRGFWFSFSLELDKLVLVAEKNRAKYKEKLLSDQKKNAREQALKALKSEHDL